MADEAYNQDKARAAADARRKRILAKSNERIKTVSGLVPSDATDDLGTSMRSEAGGEVMTDASEVMTDASSSRGGAARLKAMRRRRFNKAKKDEDDAQQQQQQATAEDATATTTTTETETTKTEEEKPAAPEATSTTATTTSSSDKESTTTKEEKQEEEEEEKKPDDLLTQNSETKKKYKGVARMRREMLHKKKQEELKQEENPQTSSNNNNSASDPSASAKQNELPDWVNEQINRKKGAATTLSILMHILTVLLLFGTGVDVGILLSHKEIDNIIIHKELTTQQIQQDLTNFQTKIIDTESYTYSSLKKTFTFHTEKQPRGLSSDEDEFGEGTVKGVVEQEETPVENIDPLFRVDLDKLTQGQEGLFYTLARMAIKIHRTMLSMLYLPIANIKTLLAIPSKMLSTPPLMCILALVIRQVVASKFVLNVPNLPLTIEDDIRQTSKILATANAGKSSGEMKDIMGMIKDTVLSFVTNSFPTLVTLYHIWINLRADMYILLFGVYVGLAYSTTFIDTSTSAATTIEPDEVPVLQEEIMDAATKEFVEDTMEDIVAAAAEDAMAATTEEVMASAAEEVMEAVTEGISDEL